MRKRTRQGLLLLLGLALAGSAWYGMKAWLKPQPLWVYQPTGVAPEDIFLSVSCLSNDGRWMVVSIVYRKVTSARRYEVIDRQTGQAVTTLDTSRIFHEYNRGYIHSAQPFTLAKDCLWWFAHRMDGDEVVIQLKRLPFLTSQQEQVVHHWRFPSKLRGFIRCVETDALHIIFNLRSELESALHVLNALTQDGLTLLCHYQTVWATTNYAGSWSVTHSDSGFQCQRKNHWFESNTGDSLVRAPIDEQGIAYSNWSKLRADNVISGEAVGQYPLPKLDYAAGWHYLRGNLLVYHRYFNFYSPGSGYSGEFDPRGFVQHPNATFYDYRFLFDKTTRQPVKWPADMHRDILGDDMLSVATDQPNQFLLTSKLPTSASFFDRDLNLCFLTRHGDSLVRDKTLVVKNARAVVYSPDATQLYVDRIRYYTYLFPMMNKVVTTFPSLQKFTKYLPTRDGSMDVLSASTGETLFSIPDVFLTFDSSDLSYRTLAQHQIILLRSKSPNQFPMQGYALECWQVPFVIHSAWWARSVALVVFVLYWFSWCRWKRRLVK